MNFETKMDPRESFYQSDTSSKNTVSTLDDAIGANDIFGRIQTGWYHVLITRLAFACI